MLYKTMMLFAVGAQAMPSTGTETHALDTKIDDVAAKVSAMAMCPLDQCRPGGTYNGHYSFTTWRGNPAGCSATYCDLYKPGGMFASRCTAAPGSFDRGYADEECIGSCTGCPPPPPPCSKDPAFSYSAYGGKVCYNSPALAAAGSGGCGTFCIDDASYFNGDPGAKTCNPVTRTFGGDNSAALMCKVPPPPPTVGCDINQCRPGGTYNGHYTFTNWIGNAAGCTESYCTFYEPGGRFHSRCSAPKGSFERGYADEECLGTCTGVCPLPVPAPPKSPKCDVAAYQRYQAALAAAEKAKKTAVATGVFNDATATASATAASTYFEAAASAAKAASDAEALYASAHTPANQAAAEAAELAAETASKAAETAEKAYMLAWSSDQAAAKQAAAAMDRAQDAHDAATALITGKC